MNLGVNVAHEGVKVRTLFSGYRRGFIKQVHQHRLAATNAAVEIEPLRRRRFVTRAETEPIKPALLAAFGRVAVQCARETGKLFGGELLRRIGLQFAGIHQRAITL
jgi:hypothetical protein